MELPIQGDSSWSSILPFRERAKFELKGDTLEVQGDVIAKVFDISNRRKSRRLTRSKVKLDLKNWQKVTIEVDGKKKDLLVNINQIAHKLEITPEEARKRLDRDKDSMQKIALEIFRKRVKSDNIKSPKLSKHRKDHQIKTLDLQRRIFHFVDSGRMGSFRGSSARDKRFFLKTFEQINIKYDQIQKLRSLAGEKIKNGIENATEFTQEELEEIGIKDIEVTLLTNGNILFRTQESLGNGESKAVWKGVEIRTSTWWMRHRAAISEVPMGEDQDPDVLALLQKMTPESHVAPALRTEKVEANNNIKKTGLVVYEGGDANKFIGSKKFKRALRLVIGAALGLRTLHRLGIIHRDLKPGNLLIRTDYKGKKTADVGDNELACFEDKAKYPAGTPWYFGPEMVGKGTVNTKKTDLWAFGLVIWQMFYGKKKAKDEIVEGVFPPFIDQIREDMHKEKVSTLITLTERISKLNIFEFGFPEPKNKAEEKIQVLIRELLSLNPKERPSIERVVTYLLQAARDLKLQVED